MKVTKEVKKEILNDLYEILNNLEDDMEGGLSEIKKYTLKKINGETNNAKTANRCIIT